MRSVLDIRWWTWTLNSAVAFLQGFFYKRRVVGPVQALKMTGIEVLFIWLSHNPVLGQHATTRSTCHSAMCINNSLDISPVTHLSLCPTFWTRHCQICQVQSLLEAKNSTNTSAQHEESKWIWYILGWRSFEIIWIENFSVQNTAFLLLKCP